MDIGMSFKVMWNSRYTQLEMPAILYPEEIFLSHQLLKYFFYTISPFQAINTYCLVLQ